MRTVSLQQVSSGVERHGGADLVFEPPNEGHKLLDWRSFDTLVEIGYRSAVAAIERWQTKPWNRSAD